MTGLVDLHCHILPGVDDGAVDLDDALGMAAQAAADGIATVCATPHIRHDHDVRIGELAERVARLNAAIDERGVATRVVVGGEVAETAAAHLDAAELDQVTLGAAGRWALLEPGPGPLGDPLLAAVDHLGALGTRAVIGHPERHIGERFHELLRACVERGALVQVTAALVLADETGPALVGLARDGLAHLVASDAHSSRWGRPVAIAAAIDALREGAGEDVARFARQAPVAMLAGADVEPPRSTT